MVIASQPEQEEARRLLDDLFQEVVELESELAGGTKMGRGGQALTSLRETTVTLGDPRHELVKLTQDSFLTAGVDLKPIFLQQMMRSHDFYSLSLTASLMPGPGSSFSRLECQLDFKLPEDAVEVPLVCSMFPQSKWREVLQLGQALDLGVNGNLQWEAGVRSLSAATPDRMASAGLSAGIEGGGKAKLFLTVPSYTYSLGHAEISATGEGNDFCFWRIDDPTVQRQTTGKFSVVFKMPAGSETLLLEARLAVVPDFHWLTARLGDVASELGERFKKLFRKAEADLKGAEELPIGDHEAWEIKLPK